MERRTQKRATTRVAPNQVWIDGDDEEATFDICQGVEKRGENLSFGGPRAVVAASDCKKPDKLQEQAAFSDRAIRKNHSGARNRTTGGRRLPF